MRCLVCSLAVGLLAASAWAQDKGPVVKGPEPEVKVEKAGTEDRDDKSRVQLELERRRAMLVRRHRFHAYLARHPMLRKELFDHADKDKDGELSDEERKAARELYAKREDKWREQYGEKLDELREHLDLNKDGKVGPMERGVVREVAKKVDTNGDGKLQLREIQRAKEVHELRDLDKDGKVSGNERRVTRRVIRHADKDDDGKLDAQERRHAKRVIERKSERRQR